MSADVEVRSAYVEQTVSCGGSRRLTMRMLVTACGTPGFWDVGMTEEQRWGKKARSGLQFTLRNVQVRGTLEQAVAAAERIAEHIGSTLAARHAFDQEVYAFHEWLDTQEER